MKITFEEARNRVADATEGDWDGPGTYYVAPDGYEDAGAFLVTVGAEEWLAANHPDYSVPGDPLFLVDKQTGAVTVLSELADHDRIDAMTPVTITT